MAWFTSTVGVGFLANRGRPLMVTFLLFTHVAVVLSLFNERSGATLVSPVRPAETTSRADSVPPPLSETVILALGTGAILVLITITGWPFTATGSRVQPSSAQMIEPAKLNPGVGGNRTQRWLDRASPARPSNATQCHARFR